MNTQIDTLTYTVQRHGGLWDRIYVTAEGLRTEDVTQRLKEKAGYRFYWIGFEERTNNCLNGHAIYHFKA